MEGSSTLTGRSIPVLDQVRDLDPAQFAAWSESLLNAGMEILNTINRQVKDGKINTVQAAGIMACTMGQLFDYQTFHDPNALAYLLRQDGQPPQQH